METLGNLDILFIFETWLNDTYSDCELNIPGYVQYCNDRIAREEGGILAHVREEILVQRRSDLENNNQEIMWLEISYPKMKPILPTGVYRSPVTNLSTIITYFEGEEF